jgi:insecticidal toxin complex protein TccC
VNGQPHANTPVLAVFDGRAGPVRRVDYLRGSAGDETQALVTAQAYDVAGRIVAQWDPRLYGTETANLLSLYSLSGTPLRTESVDGGLRRELFGVAGQKLHGWDARHSEQKIDYDLLLRPTLIRERTQGQAWTTVEYLHYGDSSVDSARHNQCGRLRKHYDTAGQLSLEDYSMAGAPLHQSRRFLEALASPDWPQDEAGCDALLEPTCYETHWRYSAMAEILGSTDAGGHAQHLDLDIAGQLKACRLQWTGSPTAQLIVDQLQYTAQGQIQMYTAGNGVTTSYSHDPEDGRLSELKAVKGNDIHQHFSYGYDPVGNVTSIVDHTHTPRYHANQRTEGTRRFTYDSLYRLQSATGLEAFGAGTRPELPGLVPPADLSLRTPYTQHYEYDRGANLEKLVHGSAVPGQAHTLLLTLDPSSNRCVQWRKGEASPGFDLSFDAGGNPLSLPSSGQLLNWNPRNQLQSVTQVRRQDGDDDAEHYVYDFQGLRVRKQQRNQAASVTHVHEVRYLPGLEIRTLDDREELHVCTLHDLGINVRGLYWIKGRPDEIEQGQLRYSLEDHLGCLVKELDQDARLISHEGYYPFGGTAWWAADSEVQASHKTLRYSGKERDASGLYYYGFRYYAPWMMRWINPDPAGPLDGLNLYAMVGNNPMRFVDPLGLNRKDKFYAVFSGRTEEILKGEQHTLPPKKGKLAEQQAALKKFLQENPDARYTKAFKKKISAHAGAMFHDEDNPEATVMLMNVFNIPLPDKGVEDIPGVTIHKPRNIKLSRDNLADLGILRIDPDKFLPRLADDYLALVRTHDVQVYKGEDLTPTNLSGVEYEQSLPDLVEDLVRPHIEQSGNLIPQLAGIPGHHAEVILGNLIRLFPHVKDNLAHVTIATQKLQIVNKAEAFPACYNCANILVESYNGGAGFNILTGRTNVSHDAWKK